MKASLLSSARKLTVLPLVAATYFMVCGGPYGLEESVQSMGYKIVLAGLVLVPLIWAFPVGLMVGELASAIPAEGGYYVWVSRALGPFWGFQTAWVSLAASIFDMAIYPNLFADYLKKVLPANINMIAAIAAMFLCLVWNLFGAKKVGYSAVWLSVALLSPFLLITLVAFLRHPASVSTNSHAHNGILLGAIVLVWNFSGWDNAGTVAEEVVDPQKTYPRVMRLALLAVMLTYIFPISAIWHQHIPSDSWLSDLWPGIALKVGGPSLEWIVIIAVLLSILGTANSLVMTYSRIPTAMAADGYLPSLFMRTLPNGAPWVSILVCGAFWIGALTLTLQELIVLEVLLDSTSIVLEFIALICLRIREPGLPRPFKIWGGVAGAVLAGIGPLAILVTAFCVKPDEKLGSMEQWVFALIILAAGILLYPVVALSRRRAISSASAR